MRVRFAFGLLLVPGMVAAVAYGCGTSEAPVEDLCGWLKDPSGCYRAFFQDVGDQCGALGLGNAPKGGFLGRDKLDICVLKAGGQVIFDPKLDLKSFPLKTIPGFKMIDVNGNVCGSGSFTDTYTFSITISTYPPDGGAPGGDAGDAGAAEPITGGTFTSTLAPDRQVFDTSCPNGETHHFNQLQATSCDDYSPLLPKAEIESSPGSITQSGFVRLRIYYPPAEGDLEGAQPVVVEYFDCAIPHAPELCVDGELDGDETDVDCGGSCIGCPEGANCAVPCDCDASMGLTCTVQQNGLKKCSMGTPATNCSNQTSGTGGGGGAGGGASGTGGAGGGASGTGGAGGAGGADAGP